MDFFNFKNIIMKKVILLVLCLNIFSSCEEQIEEVDGCTDSDAYNYDDYENATVDDGSCVYGFMGGIWRPFLLVDTGVVNFSVNGVPIYDSVIYLNQTDPELIFLTYIRSQWASRVDPFYDDGTFSYNVPEVCYGCEGSYSINGNILDLYFKSLDTDLSSTPNFFYNYDTISPANLLTLNRDTLIFSYNIDDIDTTNQGLRETNIKRIVYFYREFSVW